MQMYCLYSFSQNYCATFAACRHYLTQKSDFLTANRNHTTMPRIFKPVDISKEEKESRKDYFDRHTPHVICKETAREGEKFKVKVKVGDQYPHPDEPNHFISYVQLWNRETLLAETHFTSGAFGNKPANAEVDFYIIPGPTTMNLTAMALCTNHGLWQSEEKTVKVQ